MQTLSWQWRWQVAALFLVGGFLFFFRLGSPGLMDPDEGRYAEIAREMLASGNVITPQLNFLPYLEKPPLVYWLTALSFGVLGAHEWSARLVPALSALGGLGAVYWLANRLWGRAAAFWAALITATSAGYFLLGRILTLDMTLTCCLTWGIALAYMAWRHEARGSLVWAYLLLALGVLAKGPVAVVLPALIFLTWLITERQWRQWRRLWHPGAAVLLFSLVLPWYLLVAWQNPEFMRYFFWEEHIERFLTPRIHAGQPFYFYLGVVVVGLLPWSFLLPWAWEASKAPETDSLAAADRRFLLVWFGVIFVFFSLARAKLFPYLLPGLPPLALLLGKALGGAEAAGPWRSRVWRWTVGIWLGAGLALLLALIVAPWAAPQSWGRLDFLGPYPLGLGILMVLVPFLLWLSAAEPRRLRLILVSGALGLNLLLLGGVERLAEKRSPRSLAHLINQYRQADTVIMGYQAYSQALSFYTGSPLYLFGIRGELDFGLRHCPDTPYFFGTLPQVSAFLQQHPDFFVLIDPENFKIFQTIHPFPVKVLTQWQKYLLIRNG